MSASLTMDRNLEGKKAVSSIGMIVLLVSFTMLFATLLLGYTVFRLTSDVWPPAGMERVSLVLPTMSTLVIFLSSVGYLFFEKAFFENNKSKMVLGYIATLAFGFGFIYTQFELWEQMKTMGLYVSGGIFPSMLYSMTWIHAAHIVMAILSLFFLIPTVRVGYSDNRVTWVQNVGKFWHFLGIVWLVIYVIMFVY